MPTTPIYSSDDFVRFPLESDLTGAPGEELVILPEERLIGVRMVEQSPGYGPERDGFQRFSKLLRGLIP